MPAEPLYFRIPYCPLDEFHNERSPPGAPTRYDPARFGLGVPLRRHDRAQLDRKPVRIGVRNPKQGARSNSLRVQGRDRSRTLRSLPDTSNR
ncbi:hypothetical protein GCM10011588_05250 [Nocardia jinanensis]|uniref:Uncharacterized protein n=1 Tax=Nocardia jinanensis TaxID=382504 RepID=A0A917R733_9NOCA|nr:hypothetical protein GCM10011588_05250 [Nocardia jinanensis]